MNQSSRIRPFFRTIDLVYIAVSSALIAVCAWITVPAAIPFTLQTFGVFFVLSLLGGARGTAAVLVYLFLGLAGIPVFSGFSSGIGVLLGNTSGYLLGFLAMTLVYWLVNVCLGKKRWTEILGLILGLLFCYAFGTAWFIVVYSRGSSVVALGTVLSWCVFPFIVPDLVKLALALFLSDRISRALKHLHP